MNVGSVTIRLFQRVIIGWVAKAARLAGLLFLAGAAFQNPVQAQEPVGQIQIPGLEFGDYGVIYGVTLQGDLLSLGWLETIPPVAEAALDWLVGTSWNQLEAVIPGEGTTVYAIDRDANLLWYRHRGLCNDPAMGGLLCFGVNPMTWEGPRIVGTGWRTYSKVFYGSAGVIYAIDPNGDLYWYRHLGYEDGTVSWDARRLVGTGWGRFADVFAMGNGIIYAVTQEGDLVWYNHLGWQTGEFNWLAPVTVGNGWGNFREIVPLGSGDILAIDRFGDLYWYRHAGYRTGNPNGAISAWPISRKIGEGYNVFDVLFATLPAP